MSYYIPEADEKHWTHVHAHASHLPQNCVTLSLRTFLVLVRRCKKVNANGDLLPFCCACLATVAGLLLMSVNTFSESALGILSKRTKQLIYEQAEKTLNFSCKVLKWSVIKLRLMTAELARYSLCGLNKSNRKKQQLERTKTTCTSYESGLRPDLTDDSRFRGSASGQRATASLSARQSKQSDNKQRKDGLGV